MKTLHCKNGKRSEMMNLLSIGMILLLLIIGSCKKNSSVDNSAPKPIDQISFPNNFDWATARDVNFQITALDNSDQPLIGVRFDVYTKSPEEGGVLLHSGVTDASGQLKFIRPVPTYLTQVTVTNKYIGLLFQKTVPVSSNSVIVSFGGKTPNPVHTKS